MQKACTCEWITRARGAVAVAATGFSVTRGPPGYLAVLAKLQNEDSVLKGQSVHFVMQCFRRFMLAPACSSVWTRSWLEAKTLV